MPIRASTLLLVLHRRAAGRAAPRRRSPHSRPWTCSRSSGRATRRSRRTARRSPTSASSFDVKTDSRRRRSGSSAATAATTARSRAATRASRARAGRRTARGSPSSRRTTTARRSTCTGSAQGVTARVTNLLDAPAGLAWSPDGRQLAFVMRVPAKREPLKVELPEAPKDAKWAEPLKAIDRMVYRADGEGFLPDAFAQVFVVSADGGTAAPAHRRRVRPRRRRLVGGRHARSWCRRTATRMPTSEPNDSEVYAIDVATGAIRALTKRFGPDHGARRIAGRQVRRLHRLRRHLPGLPAHAPVPPAARQRRGPRARGRPRPRRPEARPGAATAGASTSSTTTRGRRASPRCDLTGRVTQPGGRPRRRGLVAALRRRLVHRRARRHDRLQRERRPRSRAEVGVYDGGKSRRLTQLNADLFAAARTRQGRGDLEHDRRSTGAASRAG